ncbi:hypothetical protein GQ53DRAFT_779886 [Thozetella sp. PMI_491]|nr:hypothetical protein GQ53DRAFT_779886 [Thozetella sp. PMI_491]
MVYCGKPSKGCSNCRERKIRCDQREPGCGQCEKRQQLCPGYRNLVDLMFRDESSHVIKKAKAKARKRGAATGIGDSEDSSSPETESSPFFQSVPSRGRGSLSLITPASRFSNQPGVMADWSYDNSSLLPSPDSGSWPETPNFGNLLYNLAPTCQERGTAYFFSRYVTIDENACHQRFDFVYDVWKPGVLASDRQVDGVLASMTAVGLMGLANMTKSGELMDAARKSYGTALRLTNYALKNPVEAVKDTTMLSVLILGLFEMMTENTPRTAKAFQEHVNGAAALAKLRGANQFRTAAGMKMFMMLCQRVMISCIQREVPMPETLVNLRREMGKFLDASDPTWQITTPIYEVLQIRYDIKSGALTDPEVIIGRLVGIEDDFEKLIRRFPKSWHYRTFRVSRRHPAIFGDLCHLYPSMWHATVWNGIRTMRLLVLETILAEIHKDSESLVPRLMSDWYIEVFADAKSKAERMIEAINASVPQHLGLLNKGNGNLENLTPATTPISSVEVRQTPSPPTSPSSRASSSSAASSSGGESPRRKTKREPKGPTLIDPTRATSPEDESERFMLLASATNTLVWPLYMVGMSSLCTEPMKVYVIERLRTMYMETSLKQANDVANLLEEHEIDPEWMQFHLPERSPAGSRPNGAAELLV